MSAEKDYPYHQKVVSLGGGTGHFTWLRGAVNHNNPEFVTAVVSTWDSGGSSGELRVREGTLPPGDYMQCLLGMMEDRKQLRAAINILRDRSTDPHPLVNRLASTAEKQYHSVEGGIDALRELFKIRGKIVLVSLDDIELKAETKNGIKFDHEHQIDGIKEDGQFRLEDEISRIFLDPHGYANPRAITAIQEADKIVFPPGSPYTSIFPHLQIEGIAGAILQSPATLVVTLNLMTRGEDHHLISASRWLQVFQYYLGDKKWIKQTGRSRIDYMIVNGSEIESDILDIYRTQKQFVIGVDREECERLAPGMEVIPVPDLADYNQTSHILRHSPPKLAQAIFPLHSRRLLSPS